VDESASEYVHADLSHRVGRQTRCVQRVHFEADWVYRCGRAEAAAVILMEGPEKHGGKDYWFSADALAPDQVAETLTAATGHKFTADVRDVEGFAKEMGGPGSTYESGYAKGGPQLFREVEHGRMAYIGTVVDDTKKNKPTPTEGKKHEIRRSQPQNQRSCRLSGAVAGVWAECSPHAVSRSHGQMSQLQLPMLLGT
jgi:hypothetical protein